MKVETNYEYNNMIYTIVGTQELHRQLQSDSRLFKEYVTTHAETLEMQAANASSQDEEEFLVWTSKKILLLLDEIEKVKLDLRNPKIKKRDIWRRIKDAIRTQGIRNVTEDMIERKFRNMKATFIKIKHNKKKTSTGEIKWPYYDIMEQIFEEDKTVNIGHNISSPLHSPSPPSDEQLSETNANCSSVAESTTPGVSSLHIAKLQTTPVYIKNRKKSERGKQLYSLRKRQLDMEESRLQELTLLRKSIEENNKMQAERNKLLKEFLEKQK